MANSFFPNRALFWTFWASIVFILGMIGYFLMDVSYYLRPNALDASQSSVIYVILAAAFVVDSTLQLLAICNINSNTHRYYSMVLACVFDQVGSYAYLLGALLTATALSSSSTIWIFNTVGVSGFVVGAILNMFVPGSSCLQSWANNLNLVGALLYLLAVIITRLPYTQIIVIFGDAVYLVDSVLYGVCWFSDRQLARGEGQQILIVHK